MNCFVNYDRADFLYFGGIKMKSRYKNPYFWIGLLGIILTAMGVSVDMLTNWTAVWTAIVNLVTNPFMLGSVAVAVIGVFVDPTTKGLGDGK